MTMTAFDTSGQRQRRWLTGAVLIIGTIWFAAVCWAAGSGLLARLWLPMIALLVSLGIILPTAGYFAVPGAKDLADRIGIRAMTALHIWRIPAALVFFWYGLNGQLPPLFWILAGTGDLFAGAWALAVTARQGAAHSAYARMHRFGLFDFVLAVGTGLAFTLLLDPRMAPIAEFPLALIPLFGVGISGATHLMAFDMLRRARISA
jgi:hypothetical protein